jgi:tRNA(Arg) A34 adenosine deaminase TadA
MTSLEHHSLICATPRRRFLRGVAVTAAGLMPSTLRAQSIEQPPTPGPAAFIQRAFAMRELAVQRGDQAFGAVAVRAGRIVGEGVSAVITSTDPRAHGEIRAIRDACRRLGTRDLSGAELYSSFRPCPMCEAAAHWAGIARMFHGSSISDAGAPRLNRY